MVAAVAAGKEIVPETFLVAWLFQDGKDARRAIAKEEGKGRGRGRDDFKKLARLDVRAGDARGGGTPG